MIETKSETHSYYGPHDLLPLGKGSIGIRLNRSHFSFDCALVDLFISYIYKAKIFLLVSFQVCFQKVFNFLNYHFMVLYVWMFCLHKYVCTICMPGTHKSQKVLDSLGLESKTVVSLHSDAGN